MKTRTIVNNYEKLEDYWGESVKEMLRAHEKYYYDKSLENEKDFATAKRRADEAWEKLEAFLETEWP